MGTVTALDPDLRDRLAEAEHDRISARALIAALRPDGPGFGPVWLAFALDVLTRGTAPCSPERDAAVAVAFQLGGPADPTLDDDLGLRS